MWNCSWAPRVLRREPQSTCPEEGTSEQHQQLHTPVAFAEHVHLPACGSATIRWKLKDHTKLKKVFKGPKCFPFNFGLRLSHLLSVSKTHHLDACSRATIITHSLECSTFLDPSCPDPEPELRAGPGTMAFSSTRGCRSGRDSLQAPGKVSGLGDSSKHHLLFLGLMS